MAIVHAFETTTKNGLNYTVRSPNKDDAEGILTLAKVVAAEGEYQVSEFDEFTMTLEQEIEWIEKLNSSEWNLALVAEFNGKVVGFLDFHCNSRRRRLAHTGSFGMSVLKEFRDQRIGTSLIETMLNWAEKTNKIEKISLAVFATNERAIRVYKNLGFLEEGRRVKEIKIGPNQYVDDILMYKLLKALD